MSTKRGVEDVADPGEAEDAAGDLMELTPLGAGQEVGRSCMYMTFKGKTIMFDCGVHPAYAGYNSLPLIDNEFDITQVDILLITHFHLDHCASLPYILFKTGFKGRVFMTHATKAVYHMMLSDFIRVSKVSTSEMLFDEHDLKRSMAKIEAIDFHEEKEVNGVSFWTYHAGHVLGAAMFMVDIAGTRVLYTGDYSREEDRHLKAAEMPEVSPDVVVVESTYGVQSHQSRSERESRFTQVLRETVTRGGRVLIPAFALGRAQELLLIMEEFWEANPDLQHVPIYYASPLAKRCMKAYQTYINSMNDRIRQQYAASNPWVFKWVHNLRGLQDFDDSGPAIVMASPGMLQSGMSRQLFDMWCTDPLNSCLIAGYCVEGTLAKYILTEPTHVTLMSGLEVPLKMAVHYISFSAHADYTQTADFLSELQAPNILLVHGEANEMGRLKQALQHKFQAEGKNTQVMNPKNCQSVQLRFRSEKVARAVGSLLGGSEGSGGGGEVHSGQLVSGLLVQRGFGMHLLAPKDLRIYTQLQGGQVLQRQSVPFLQDLELLYERLKQIFDGVSMTEKRGLLCVQISSLVYVLKQTASFVVVEWSSDPIADMLADSVLALLLQLDANPRLPPRSQGLLLNQPSTQGASTSNTADESSPELLVDKDIITVLLRDIFGNENVSMSKRDTQSETDEGDGEHDGGALTTIVVDGVEASIDHSTNVVTSENTALKGQVSRALQRIRCAILPIDIGC